MEAEVARGKHLTWPQMKKVMDRLSAETGLKPLGRTQTFERLKLDRDGGQFDRLVNQMPKHRPGNRTERFHSQLYDLVREAVFTTIAALGTWKMVRAEIKILVRDGAKYEHLRSQVLDGEGNFLLKQSFLGRTIKGCNLYVKDLLVHGPDFAQRKHADYLRQIRATAPLERVDADFAQFPVMIIDDELDIAFGKPWTCVLRDRFTAIPLGWSVGFGNPSFQLFLEALQHAIFEKTDLPEGMEYPYGGLGFGYQGVKRKVNTPWVDMPVGQTLNQQQWTGPTSDEVTISGVLFPKEFGGQSQLDGIIAASMAGTEMMLVTGDAAQGVIQGMFTVQSVEEDRSYINRRGEAGRNAYSITLKRSGSGTLPSAGGLVDRAASFLSELFR